MSTHNTYAHSAHRLFRTIMAMVVLLCIALPAAAQDIIRVQGHVYNKNNNKPVYAVFVKVKHTPNQQTQTDADGKFIIDVPKKGTLVFSRLDMNGGSMEVRVKNPTEIDTIWVDIEEESGFYDGKIFQEAEKIVQRKKPQSRMGRSIAKMKGDYQFFNINVEIDDRLFPKDSRVVVQPIVYNVTRNTYEYRRPFVYDAREYNITQKRMYCFDMKSKDPLCPYIKVEGDSAVDVVKWYPTTDGKQEVSKKNERRTHKYTYSDSSYLENKSDYVINFAYIVHEDYKQVYQRDTAVFSRGVIHPIRWLDYHVSSYEMEDTLFIPKADLGMHSSNDKMDLVFLENKAALDMDNPKTVKELEKLYRQMAAVSADTNSSLRALEITCTSSPEGNYAHNLTLTAQRIAFALNQIKSHVKVTISDESITKTPKVAGWEEVVDSMRADSLNDEADKVQAIINRYKNIAQRGQRMDLQGADIRRLPFYQSVIKKTYLPKLRRVEYKINFLVLRDPTVEEIKEKYAKDSTNLKKYEYFKLYRNEPDTLRRMQICRQALTTWTDFVTAANDLQAMLIKRGKPEMKLLEKFAGKYTTYYPTYQIEKGKKPVAAEVNANHAIALLLNQKFSQADSITQYLPENDERFGFLKSICNIVAGEGTDEDVETVASSSPRNGVVMKLITQQHEEAYELCKQLPDNDPVSHYLLATCLLRRSKANNDDGLKEQAKKELDKAMAMDPKLRQVALSDADINELLIDNEKFDKIDYIPE